MKQEFSDYYFIQLDDKNIGEIRIIRLKGNVCRISPMFILPEFQGKGYTQQTIKAVEASYSQADSWELDTIKEETKLCHIYEKMGYKSTGKQELIKDNMTIVYYSK